MDWLGGRPYPGCSVVRLPVCPRKCARRHL